MTLSRRSAITAIGVVGTGSMVSGTVLAVSEHEDDERDSEAAPEDENVGAIRVGHFSPDAPNVDVYIEDQQILSDVAYDELSPYLEIVPGTYAMTITAAGDEETVVYEDTISVDATYYTAAAIGELEDEDDNAAYEAAADEDGDGEASGNETEAPETSASIQQEDEPAGNETNGTDGDTLGNGTEVDESGDETETGTFDVLLLVDTEPEDVEENTSQVRLVHASPDAPAVDIVDGETGNPIFEGVAFTEPSGYVPVEPGSQTLEIFPAADGGGTGLEDDPTGDGGLDDASGANETVESDNETAENPETAASIQQEDEPSNETDDGGATELGDDEVISQPDPVATVELDLEEGTAYTAYAIGYLTEVDGGTEGDIEEEDEITTIEIEAEMAGGPNGDGSDDATEDGDDRSFAVRVAVDGTTEDEETDTELEEDELNEDDLDGGGNESVGANETDGQNRTIDDDDYAGNGTNDTEDDELNGTGDSPGQEPATADD